MAAHLAEVDDVEVSRETISKITDRVLEGLQEWQNRPLDAVYPVVFIDGVNVKIRDGNVANRPIYVALAVTVDGERDILGLWAGVLQRSTHPGARARPSQPWAAGHRGFRGSGAAPGGGVSGVTAAVAMQFDLEDIGAVVFSRAFYENLLQRDLALDEVVTMARRALVLHLQAGHRAWLTPAVHWRCQGGRVFEIDLSVRPLDAQTLASWRESTPSSRCTATMSRG